MVVYGHMAQSQSIQNVRLETMKKFRQAWWQFLITFLVTSAIGVWLYDGTVDDAMDAVKLVLVVLSLHISWVWSRHYGQFHRRFMSQFAAEHKLVFTAVGQTTGRHGKLFKHLRSGKLFNIVSGTILGLPSELFNYTYKSGSGKATVTHEVTALQVTFKGLVPNFAVIEKKETIDSILRPGPGQYTHELEGDFFKFYKLYVTDNFEIEILEILTPEIMAFMIDEGKHLSFEFIENQLFIYQDKYIGEKQELVNFVTLARLLLGRLHKRIGRLHDDVAAMSSVAK